MDTEESKLYVAVLIGISALVSLIVIYFVSILRSQYVLKTYERFNAQAGISVRDKERKRIAADLHDTMGSSLIAIKFQLADLKSLIPAHSAIIQKSIDAISESIVTMRKVSHNMMPELLIQSGLGTALGSLIYQDKILNKKEIYFEYTLPCFCPENSIHVYYIIKEILTNSQKHSKASILNISMKYRNRKIELKINDNGVGFDKIILSKKPKGLGMYNIYTRTAILNGTVHLDTSPGNGVSYLIELPGDLMRKKSNAVHAAPI